MNQERELLLSKRSAKGCFGGGHVCEELKLKCCYDVWMCQLEHNRIREGE